MSLSETRGESFTESDPTGGAAVRRFRSVFDRSEGGIELLSRTLVTGCDDVRKPQTSQAMAASSCLVRSKGPTATRMCDTTEAWHRDVLFQLPRAQEPSSNALPTANSQRIPKWFEELGSWGLGVPWCLVLGPLVIDQLPHSYLSATIGSTRDARRAGRKPASAETAAITSVATPIVIASVGARP